jgi:hypothetical protein
MKQLGGVLAIGVVLALAACDRRPPATVPADETRPAAAGEPAAPTPMPATAPANSGPARLDGYGPVALGASLDDVRTAWKEPLQGEVADDYCHALRPEGAQADDVVFMIEGRKLVRYDVRNDRIVAPGGGKVGMTQGELQALYPERADLTPHKYEENGHNLRVRPADEGGAILNFEIGGNGTVTAWRVGLPPQVDYVEGCS